MFFCKLGRVGLGASGTRLTDPVLWRRPATGEEHQFTDAWDDKLVFLYICYYAFIIHINFTMNMKKNV